jgi:hypothetical protein
MLEDDTKLVDMKKSGCSWKEINAAFPEVTDTLDWEVCGVSGQ